MNGYKLMADSYRQAIEEGKVNKAAAEKKIRIYDFLSTCDMDDICELANSSAFNDIFRGYLRTAMIRAEIPEELREQAMNEYRLLLSEKDAKTALDL